MRKRIVVVGAGSAGCVLASELSEHHDVVLFEAGRRVAAGGDANAHEALAHPSTWSLSAQLTSGRRWTAHPGRAVGGSSVVNGGYFAAPEQVDLDRWHAAGGSGWEPDAVLAHIDRHAQRLGVQLSPHTHPIVRAFREASERAGLSSGLLTLHTTVSASAPRNVADAFLRVEPGGVLVRSDCRAARVVIADGRAVGVDVAGGDGSREVVLADEVVLTAGGFGSARLLLASGIGPAEQLRAVGIEPVVDLPGVGAAFSDHPTVWVTWMPTPALVDAVRASDVQSGAFPVALCLGADGGAGDDLEILACVLPPDPAGGAVSENTPFGVIVGLQRPHSRGTVAAASARPFSAATIDYDYLSDARDREALRHGVRAAARLIGSEAFAPLVARIVDLDADLLADDGRLDAWIEDHLASAAHASGTAPMGSADDPLAVVDGAGRVRGVAGLRVADTSILPSVPSRGPAAAAMAVGSVIAGHILADLHD